MRDTSITKLNSAHSPKGELGQKYLAAGVALDMRLWEAEKPGDEPEHARPYETIGYVISGKAELHLEGQKVVLEKGDSWVVPKGTRHHYRIVEPFTAVEVAHPPSRVEQRDRPH